MEKGGETPQAPNWENYLNQLNQLKQHVGSKSQGQRLPERKANLRDEKNTSIINKYSCRTRESKGFLLLLKDTRIHFSYFFPIIVLLFSFAYLLRNLWNIREIDSYKRERDNMATELQGHALCRCASSCVPQAGFGSLKNPLRTNRKNCCVFLHGVCFCMLIGCVCVCVCACVKGSFNFWEQSNSCRRLKDILSLRR